MGGFVDFSPLRLPNGLGEGVFDPLVDTLKGFQAQAEARRKQQAEIAAARQRQEQQLNFERERENRLSDRDEQRFQLGQRRQARLDQQATDQQRLAERRFVGSETMKNQGARTQRDKAIQDAVAAGDLATAERLAQYQEQDPATGDVRTMSRFQRIEPVLPQRKPLEPATPNLVGPRMSPDVAERADILESGIDTDAEPGTRNRDAQAAWQANDEAVARNTAAEQENAAAQARYEAERANPRVRIGDIETSVGDVRYAAGRQNLIDFDKQGEVLKAQREAAYKSGDPIVVAIADRRVEQHEALRPAVASGGVDLKTAENAIDKATVSADANLFRHGEGGVKHGYDMDLQRLKNQAPRPSLSFGKANVDIKEQNAFESAHEHFLKQWKVSDQRFDSAKLQALADNPEQPISQRAIASVLSRQLAGERGVLTDQDINRLQKNLAGWLPEIENWFQKGATGELAPEILKQLRTGIGIVLRERKQMDDRAKRAFHNTFMRSGSPFEKQGLLPYARNMYEADFGEPYDERAFGGGGASGGAGGGGAGGGRLTPEQRQQLIEKLRARGMIQ